MTPNWLKVLLEANCGEYCDTPEADNAGIQRILEQDFLPAMWSSLLRRFGSEERPRPKTLVIDSPAAKPLSIRHGEEEYLVFDRHLYDLIEILTILPSAGPPPEIVNQVAYTAYAERAFAAGEVEDAMLIATKARFMRAGQSKSLYVHSEVLEGSKRLAFVQLAFIFAHELSHLVFSADPQKAKTDADEHAQQIYRILERADVASGPKYFTDRSDTVRDLFAQGYVPNAKTLREERMAFPDELIPPRHELWNLVADNDVFVEECMADLLAASCMIGVMNNGFVTEELIVLGATMALRNMGTLQHLDLLANGQNIERVDNASNSDFWLAHFRAMILIHTLGAGLLHLGIDRARLKIMSQAHAELAAQYIEVLFYPFVMSLDFRALADKFRLQKDILGVAMPIAEDVTSSLRHLGFGQSTERARKEWYLEMVEVLGQQ